MWAVLWTTFQIAWFCSGGLLEAILQLVAAVPAVLLVLRITAPQEAAAAVTPLRLGEIAR